MTPSGSEALHKAERMAGGWCPRPWPTHSAASDSGFEGVAGAAFVLMFPVFMAYQYGISAGWWGAFLGGLFGASAMLVAALASVFAVTVVMRNAPVHALHVLFLLLLVHMSVWSLAHLPLIDRSEWTSPVMTESFATLTIWVALFFVGARFPSRPPGLRWVSSLSWLLVLLCFAHAFYAGGFPAGPFLAFANAEEGGHSTYQGIGRSLLAVGAIAALAWRPDSLVAVGSLVAAAVLMLTLGSRAHFFVLCLLIVLHVSLLLVRRQTFLRGAFSLAVLLAVAATSLNLFLETRAAEIVELAESASWTERGQANERALAVIAERPLAGAFGYHSWDEAGYAHNLLSAWTQYGLLGFLGCVLLMLSATLLAIAGYRRGDGQRAAWLVAMYLNVVCIVLAVASEPIMSSAFPALAWGFTARAMRLERTGAAYGVERRN